MQIHRYEISARTTFAAVPTSDVPASRNVSTVDHADSKSASFVRDVVRQHDELRLGRPS
jgi:hypothetical protein